jgi:hypothetical protein
MAVLHQAIEIDGVIAIGSSSIKAALLDRNFVDFAGGIPEIGFEFGPVGFMKSSEDDTKAIVGTFDGTEGLSQQGLEKMKAFGSPVLDMDFAMTGLGENESQPNTHEPAVGDPLMEMMGSQMLLQDCGQLHFFEEADQQRNVIDTLML